LLPAAPSNNVTYLISGNTPSFTKQAIDNGPANQTDQITATAWLKLHNENQLSQLLTQQTTKGSGQFHKWLTQDQFNASFSPTAQEVNAVQNFLSAHNLTVLFVAENNFYVKVQGSIADIQKTFHVQIHNYNFSGAVHRSNSADPSVNDTSGGNIAAITGMDDYGFEPAIVFPSKADGSAFRLFR
jgi:subtilase family serine protease